MKLNNPISAFQAVARMASGATTSPIKPGGKQDIKCAQLDEGRIAEEKAECENAGADLCKGGKAEFQYGQKTGGGPDDCYMSCRCIDGYKGVGSELPEILSL